MDSNTQIIISLITFAGVFVGSGIVQFLITRRDKKKEDEQSKKLDILREEFKDGLDKREATGKERFDHHELAIQKMDLQHQKDFQELKLAIQKLTENDSKITKSLESVGEVQSSVADSLVGMAHDRILQFTNYISDRGSITNREKSTLKSMFNPYHNLGGNGEVKEAYEYVLTLPTVSEETAREKDSARKYQQFAQYIDSTRTND